MKTISYLSLLHDVLDLLVLRLQILVGLGQVGEPPLVLVVPAHNYVFLLISGHLIEPIVYLTYCGIFAAC